MVLVAGESPPLAGRTPRSDAGLLQRERPRGDRGGAEERARPVFAGRPGGNPGVGRRVSPRARARRSPPSARDGAADLLTSRVAPARRLYIGRPRRLRWA